MSICCTSISFFCCSICLWEQFLVYAAVPLTTYICKIWGKCIGWVIGLCYTSSFIYSGARVFRDFEELLSVAAYQSTSILVLGICMVLCIMYAVYKEFEVFVRVGELCFFYFVYVFYDYYIGVY
ncbi:hypothetical protein COL91_27630 [Bacillus pseudomycoides]|nr:hypothetical protein COO02_22550 [Bacillus pseudomycoides]PGA81148.1 hypothetical protein COL91_27630 [Bacillus pseudomycoides]PHF39825.1 hypothetical protein COF72_21815 [Bacillus pseudomycoides]